MENSAGHGRGSAGPKMEHARDLGMYFSCSRNHGVVGQTCLDEGVWAILAKFGRCEPRKEPVGQHRNSPRGRREKCSGASKPVAQLAVWGSSPPITVIAERHTLRNVRDSVERHVGWVAIAEVGC